MADSRGFLKYDRALPERRPVARAPEHALRAPFVFDAGADGRWMFYAARGEYALGVTPLD